MFQERKHGPAPRNTIQRSYELQSWNKQRANHVQYRSVCLSSVHESITPTEVRIENLIAQILNSRGRFIRWFLTYACNADKRREKSAAALRRHRASALVNPPTRWQVPARATISVRVVAIERPRRWLENSCIQPRGLDSGIRRSNHGGIDEKGVEAEKKIAGSLRRLSLILLPCFNERPPYPQWKWNAATDVARLSFNLSSRVGRHPVGRMADVGPGKKLTEFPEIYKRATRLGVARRHVNREILRLVPVN